MAARFCLKTCLSCQSDDPVDKARGMFLRINDDWRHHQLAQRWIHDLHREDPVQPDGRQAPGM